MFREILLYIYFFLYHFRTSFSISLRGEKLWCFHLYVLFLKAGYIKTISKSYNVIKFNIRLCIFLIGKIPTFGQCFAKWECISHLRPRIFQRLIIYSQVDVSTCWRMKDVFHFQQNLFMTGHKHLLVFQSFWDWPKKTVVWGLNDTFKRITKTIYISSCLWFHTYNKLFFLLIIL